MRRWFLAFAVAAAGMSAHAGAAEPTLKPADQAQLERNLTRGAELYRYDQSAWHVTDAALAALPETAKAKVRGYITTPAPNGTKTTLFGDDEGRAYALYSAVWTGSAVADAKSYPTEQHVPVSADEERLIEARKVALEDVGSLQMCNSAPPNVIVIPGESPNDPVSVYVLTPQTKNDVYPLGGHHRIDVRGGKIVAKRDFTKGCIDFDKASVPRNGKPEAAFITHLLDPVPTEVHVFSAFAMGLPLFVAVPNGRVYAVEVSGGVPRARLIQTEK